MLFFANANMAIRTYVLHSSRYPQSNEYDRMVIWGMKLYIVVPLCLLSVGYWVLAIQCNNQPSVFLRFNTDSNYRCPRFWWNAEIHWWMLPHEIRQTDPRGHLHLPRRSGFHRPRFGGLQTRHPIQVLPSVKIDEAPL